MGSSGTYIQDSRISWEDVSRISPAVGVSRCLNIKAYCSIERKSQERLFDEEFGLSLVNR